MMKRPILAAILLAALLVQPGAAQTGYLETFDQFSVSAPLHVAPPAPDRVPGLDVLTHSRNSGSWQALQPMIGADAIQHGPNCESPPATHDSQTPGMGYEESVFVCNDHLMTAINDGGYGLIYLTPSHLVDFSAGEAVIKFDVSTFRSSKRDWIDVWITPYEENLTAPLETAWPDLVGVPRRSVHVLLGSGNNWAATVYGNHEASKSDLPMKWWVSYSTLFIPSSVRRDSVEIRLTTDRLKVCMPTYNYCWNYDPFGASISPPLDWTRGVVQVGHHSYNPQKDCVDRGAPAEQCPPNTWHWDNLSISPSVPFTIIRSNERFAQPTQDVPMMFTFPSPAPIDSHLRVAAHGIGMEVSLDDGQTWSALIRQPSDRPNDGAFNPFWHPIPAGTTSVLLRATQPNAAGPNAVNYAAIWSPNAIEGPPEPSVTPTATPTDIPATPTATSTVTPTPVPQCRSPYERSADGGQTWTPLTQPMGCP